MYNKSSMSVGEVLDTIPYQPEGDDLALRPKAKTEAKPTEKPAAQPEKKKSKTKLPTLANAEREKSTLEKKQGKFSEDELPKNIFSKASPAKTKIQNLKNMSPEERAQTGAKFGGGVGLGVSGPTGAVVGAAVGAMAARGLGAVQSGEHQDNLNRDKIIEGFKEWGVTDKKGNVKFEDGASIPVTNDPSIKMRNVNPLAVNGQKDRNIHQLDKSHPMANRTTTVARPIARYIAQGMLGFTNPNNPQDMQAIDATTAMLVNILQEGAKSIDQVYARSRELIKKLKANENQMRSFFDTIKTSISEKEAGDIKKGLDILYA